MISAANNHAPNWTEAGGLQYRGTVAAEAQKQWACEFNEAHPGQSAEL